MKNSGRKKADGRKIPALYSAFAIGFIRSDIKRRSEAARQGAEGAPDAWLEFESRFVEGLHGISVGEEILVITWLHEA